LLELVWLVIVITFYLGLPILCLYIAFRYFIMYSFKEKKVIWRNLLAIIPFLLCAILIYFINIPATFRSIRDTHFKAQFYEYQNIVDKYSNETANVDHYDQWITAPRGLMTGIRVLKYSNDKKKILEVRFSTFGSIPLLRGGYLYVSDEDVITDNKIYRNSSLVFRKIKPHWYAYSE
jgi:energy-coupling factor transporter transmembrane protein EcfT